MGSARPLRAEGHALGALRRPLLRLALGAAALALAWLAWVQPAVRRAAALRAEVEAARREIAAAAGEPGRPPGDLPALEADAARVLSRLLPAADATPLLARVAAEAARHGLRPVALRPLPAGTDAGAERPAGLTRVSVEVTLRGAYAGTGRFLAALREGPFLVRVEALRLGPDEREPWARRVTLTLAGYAREEAP